MIQVSGGFLSENINYHNKPEDKLSTLVHTTLAQRYTNIQIYRNANTNYNIQKHKYKL